MVKKNKTKNNKKTTTQNLPDPYISTPHIPMPHEQLPSCSILTIHCHYHLKNFRHTQFNTNTYRQILEKYVLQWSFDSLSQTHYNTAVRRSHLLTGLQSSHQQEPYYLLTNPYTEYRHYRLSAYRQQSTLLIGLNRAIYIHILYIYYNIHIYIHTYNIQHYTAALFSLRYQKQNLLTGWLSHFAQK